MKAKFLIPLVAVFSHVSVAHAATVTNYSGIALAGSSYTNFLIAKFDSSLGTLTGIKVFVSTAGLQGSVGITNNDTTTASIEGYDSTFNIRQAAGTDLGYGSTKSDTLYGILTLPDWSTVTLAPGGGTQVLTIDGGFSFSIADVDIASSAFGAYQSVGGTGSVTFEARNTQAVSVTGGNFTVNSTAAFANTNVGITYTYNAIPEPSAIALLGLGALGLVARRRRSA